MRIGYCCDFSPEDAAWAKDAGFTTLEIYYLDDVDDAWKRARDWFLANGLAPMSVFHYDDYAHPDASHAGKAIADCYKAMDMCKIVGAPVLALNAWAGHEGSPKEKLATFKRVFTPMAAKAADMGLKIAIENCPHSLQNIMWSPDLWEAGFNEVPNEALGLEYDPSHLVWMGVDYVAALEKFMSRTYAFHAKDTEVFTDKLEYCGIYGDGWWRYRIPGWGEIDWQKLFTILWEGGYAGDVTIEHEDPVFEGARMREGLSRGLDYLSGLVGG